MNCCKCGSDVDNSSSFPCDSCKRWVCNRCSDLSASEIRCLQMKKRVLKFCCPDCESGLLQVPVLIQQMQTNTKKLEELSEKFFQMSPTSGTNVSPSVCESMVTEAMERVKRASNVILRGVPEPQGSIRERISTDEQYVSNMLSTIIGNEPDLKPVKVVRFGKGSPDHPRLVKVVFPNSAACKRVLRNKNKLSTSPFRGISIQDDKTPKQLAYLRDLREELKSRLDAGEMDLTIKYIRGVPTIVSSRAKNQTERDTQIGASNIQT